MTKTIADTYGCDYFEVLTGFKYIGEKIKEFEESGSHTYLFGFEESYGCLSGTYARDKDAVAAVLLVCEMAAYYQSQGLSLLDALTKLYEKYGFFQESVESITLKGVEGLSDMRRIMAGLRENPPQNIGGEKVVENRDYHERKIVNYVANTTEDLILPQSDVLYYVLEDGSWLCIRPSGTEPKIKLYFGVAVEKWNNIEDAEEQAKAKLTKMSADLRERCK